VDADDIEEVISNHIRDKPALNSAASDEDEDG
jgi:hypothetical protein